MNIILEWNFKSWAFPTMKDAVDFVTFWKFPPTQYAIKQKEFYNGYVIKPADISSRKLFCWMAEGGEEILGHADSVINCKIDIDFYLTER